VLVLNEVDKLSKDAQHSLRRTMEKYSAACRLVLCCNSASKVIEAVRSRCLNIRINAPSRDEILDVLLFIAKKENLVLPPELAGRIVLQSNRNLRRAILCLEACRVQQFVSSSSLSPILKLGFVFSLQVSE
jgi:replication factor C subunit 3/5